MSSDPVGPVAARVAGRTGSVGVVVPDARVAEVGAALDASGTSYVVLGAEAGLDDDAPVEPSAVELVPASLAKGLEFDHVVLLDPAGIVAAEPTRVTGLRRLYVCLTRPVTSLTLLPDGPLPPELGAPPTSRG